MLNMFFFCVKAPILFNLNALKVQHNNIHQLYKLILHRNDRNMYILFTVYYLQSGTIFCTTSPILEILYILVSWVFLTSERLRKKISRYLAFNEGRSKISTKWLFFSSKDIHRVFQYDNRIVPGHSNSWYHICPPTAVTRVWAKNKIKISDRYYEL